MHEFFPLKGNHSNILETKQNIRIDINLFENVSMYHLAYYFLSTCFLLLLNTLSVLVLLSHTHTEELYMSKKHFLGARNLDAQPCAVFVKGMSFCTFLL